MGFLLVCVCITQEQLRLYPPCRLWTAWAKVCKFAGALFKTSCNIFTPFVSHWAFVMPLTANFYFTFDLKLQSSCLVAPCIALNIGHKLFLLWAVVCFFVFFKWQPLLHSFFHFKTRASVCFACQYITTLLMVLGHTYPHSNRGQWYVCIFAFLLSFAFSCFGSLTCYYKDMKQYSHHTHTHAPFLLTVGLLHPPHRPLNQPTPSKHTHVKCSLWLLISRFALGLSGWHC